MNPDRAAMIESGGRRPQERDGNRGRDGNRYRGGDRRDFTAPRRDDHNRISKPPPYNPSANARPYERNNNNNRPNQNQNPSIMNDEDRFVAESDIFVIRQTKKRADIRVRERRGHLIDFLVFNMRFVDEEHDPFDDEDGDEAIEVPSPDDVLATRSEDKLAELEGELDALVTLEKNRPNREYWKALSVLCRHVVKQIKQNTQNGGTSDETDQVLGSVAPEIDRLLRPKTLPQLEVLEKQFKDKLRSDAVIDTDYWEHLLKQLKIYKARAVVSNVTEASRAKRLAMLAERKTSTKEGNAGDDGVDDVEEADEADEVEDASGDIMATNAPPPGTERFAAVGNEDYSQATKALYEREVARGVGENEEIFAEEVQPAESTSSRNGKPRWADKHRPRKPRYFNRVQMGYEWNKYNQTHYDHDNPPPKVVQGYKFNIFYPELIDKTKAPTYHITREGGRRKGESFAAAGEEDTCLIRFSAGPPYEDIAFRIVDREWDYSSKRERGFKSVFEKGILQLHFQFKKIYYRK
ncbi:hypothetical protein F503_07572 [Ophiostoma piceae UAMH 11346]|uniref:Splicing factor Cactin n=1 Tax=Ophiostoma piceae (strain UAMH 11346) TaxID=1262450 RepID=S3CCS2_OPHP1|nr:hypothetical protein F503_07572 [Ophiostoma piceae UAMH 11346]